MAEAVGPAGAEMGQRSARVTASSPSASLKKLTTEALATEGTWMPTFGVQGLDVSSHQPSVDWLQQWNMGARFAYVKASEGNYYTSPTYASQYQGSRNVGMIRGAYHFAIPNWSSGADQARYFVQNGGGWTADGHTLPPVLDFEFNPYENRTINGFYFGNTCYGMSPAQLTSWVRDFGNAMLSMTGRLPAIYTNTSWWRQCLGDPAGFADYPLWVAAYPSSPTNNAGAVPASWRTYSIWQYSSTGPLAGDSNVWNGSLADLQRFAKETGTIPVNPSIKSAADILAIDSGGTLWNYGGNGAGAITSTRAIGYGFTGLQGIYAVDWNDDGTYDLLTQTKDGRLLVYLGSVYGGFSSGVQLGVGWAGMKIAPATIGTGSRYPSIVATDDRGQVWRYSNSFGTAIDSGRTSIGAISLDSPLVITDFDGNGSLDLITVRPDGNLYVAAANSSGYFSESPTPIGSGWVGASALFPVYGFNGASSTGVVGRMSNGELRYYSINPGGGWGASSVVGVGFGNFQMGDTQSFQMTPRPSIPHGSDIITADSNGTLWNNRAMTNGAVSQRQQIGVGFVDMRSLTTVDWNRDGVYDMLVQWKFGRLDVYLGNATGGFGSSITVGSGGWDAMKLAVGPWTTSGYPDVVATDSAGNLRLYRNVGNSGMLQGGDIIGTGWGQMRTTMLDWNWDGIYDLLAIDGEGIMRIYLGNGLRSFQNGATIIGMGWSDLAPVSASFNLLANGYAGVIARTGSGELSHYSVTASGRFTGVQNVPGQWKNLLIAGAAAGSW
ncbi:lysozyme [Pseudarthrobacter humi]